MADVERERVTALWREAAATFATEDDPFTDDALLRLAASSQDYYQSHGYYVPPLALRLHATRAECGRLREQLDAREQKVNALTGALDEVADAAWAAVSWAPSGPKITLTQRLRAALGVEGEREQSDE